MATPTDAIANVYARSLFELAEQAGGAEKIAELGQELEQVCEIARRDATFREFLGSPIVDSNKRGESLKRIFSNRVTDTLLRFLMVLNQKGRLGHLESINAAYDRMVNESFGRVEVDVFTAAPLGEEQRETLRQQISTALDKEPVLHPYTDPDMIGGIRLRIGDQLIDGSVSNRMKRLTHAILSRGPSALRERTRNIIADQEPPS